MQTIGKDKSENADDRFQLNVSYLADDEIIQVIVSGGLTSDTYHQLVAAVIAAIAEYGSHLILIDERNITVEMNILDVYDLPQLNTQLGVPSDLRVAIIYSISEINSRRFALYEDRAVITGMKHHIFLDERAAIEWLIRDA